MTAHCVYLRSGILLFVQSNDSAYMNAHATISTTTWLNLAMLVMNLAIWLDNATRLAG